MKHLRVAAAIAAASFALVAIATPASAAPPPPPVIDHWTDHVEDIEQEIFDDWCPDIPYGVRYVEDSHGTFRGITRGGLFYGASTWHIEGSWTNVETGKSFSKDVGRTVLTIVVDGDGEWIEVIDADARGHFETMGLR